MGAGYEKEGLSIVVSSVPPVAGLASVDAANQLKERTKGPRSD
jgi:hypothetical protein